MTQGVTRSELRKVKTIVNLIGEDNLLSLPNNQYQCLKGYHVYATKNESNELTLSIWSHPKENTSSRCLFADRISIPAYMAAADYWKPKYPPKNL